MDSIYHPGKQIGSHKSFPLLKRLKKMEMQHTPTYTLNGNFRAFGVNLCLGIRI